MSWVHYIIDNQPKNKILFIFKHQNHEFNAKKIDLIFSLIQKINNIYISNFFNLKINIVLSTKNYSYILK